MNYSNRYYAVWRGKIPGVYDNIEDALEQVDGFPNAWFQSFDSPAAATAAFRRTETKSEKQELNNLILNSGRTNIPHAGRPDYFSFPEIDLHGWAVDASCQGNPGTMEYRGVELISGRELFRVGPFKKSTNNIGEFLAIVHALALMEQSGETHTIYSDSVTGMSWVRNRKVKTNLTRSPQNEDSFRMMERALSWLNSHSYRSKILKWQTEIWGEIPADFGRK